MVRKPIEDKKAITFIKSSVSINLIIYKVKSVSIIRSSKLVFQLVSMNFIFLIEKNKDVRQKTREFILFVFNEKSLFSHVYSLISLVSIM